MCPNHKLPVRAHVYDNDFDDRCTLCTTNAIGDEYHYLFECNFFLNSRNNLIPLYHTRNYSSVNAMIFFGNLNDNQLKNIAIFMKKILTQFA